MTTPDISDAAQFVLSLLGLSREYLNAEMTKRNTANSKRLTLVRRREEETFVTNESLSHALNAFYSDNRSSDSPWKNYSLRVDGHTIPTTIYLDSRLYGTSRRIDDVVARSENITLIRPTNIRSEMKGLAMNLAVRAEAGEVGLWNGPTYRLVRFRDDATEYTFSECDFFDYRFTSGLMEDEINQALVKHKGELVNLKSPNKTLPVRSSLMPNIETLVDVGSRICCGGIGVVMALRTNGGFQIPLQVRSRRVSDGRGRLAVIPKAFHQASVASDKELHPKWTMFREIYEEVFGFEEADKNSKYYLHDYYFDRYDGMKWFLRNPDSWRAEVIAFGLNAVSGNYDFGILLIIDDESYFHEFGRSMFSNWEIERQSMYSSTNPDRIRDVLLKENWVSESVFHFGQALIRLKQQIGRAHV